MFRTVEIPIYHESWLTDKNDPTSGHTIVRAYVKGKWIRLDATWKDNKWGKPEWKISDGKLRNNYTLYTKTYLPAKDLAGDADF